MGCAHVEVTNRVFGLLSQEPYCDQVTVEKFVDGGDDFCWLLVSSPKLAEGCRRVQEMILEDGAIRFKDAVDT